MRYKNINDGHALSFSTEEVTSLLEKIFGIILAEPVLLRI